MVHPVAANRQLVPAPPTTGQFWLVVSWRWWPKRPCLLAIRHYQLVGGAVGGPYRQPTNWGFMAQLVGGGWLAGVAIAGDHPNRPHRAHLIYLQRTGKSPANTADTARDLPETDSTTPEAHRALGALSRDRRALGHACACRTAKACPRDPTVPGHALGQIRRSREAITSDSRRSTHRFYLRAP